MLVQCFRRLFLAGLTALCALALSAPAFAAPPTFQSLDIDTTNIINDCGFPIAVRFVATLEVLRRSDQNGDLVLELVRVRHGSFTYTNPATGASFTTVDTGINKYTVAPDGSMSFAIIGNILNVTVPGQGVVLQEVGRLVIDGTTGEYIFAAGQHDTSLTGNIQAFCAALA
ncbi:MAG TPA: hypothetical protein VFU22_21380 [Roseiflexaceae bacterium]|nr:hypothetical protein [Roseiflexaceae bacterium]